MRNLALLSALFLGGCIHALPGAKPHRSPLAQVVDSVISTPTLRHTTFGIEVLDAGTGQLVYALNGDKHLIPASNTKLVATSASMALLGPDWRYRTEVTATGLDGRGAAKALVLAGRGDPTWAPPFQASETAVPAALADSVKAAGVRRIDGDVVIDASRFEAAGVSDEWEIGDLIWYYAAPTSALAVGEGTRRFVVLPSVAPGLGAGVRFLGPEPLEPVLNAIVTAPTGGRPDIQPERRVGTDTLFLRGTIPSGAPTDTETITVVDAAAHAGRVLVTELAARGIQVTGTIRVVHDTVEARALGTAGGRHIATWTSAPIAEIVAACLKPSDNWIAEQLLKTLGAEKGAGGSWAEGLKVERGWLAGPVGLDTLDFRLHDGSGLSAQNLLTPHAIVRLLAHVRAQPWADRYRAAMALPGETGTLKNRLVAYRGRLFAKTGSIANVNTLSGFLRTDGGQELVFSIMTNGSGVSSSQVRAGMDRIVAAIAAGGER